MKPRIILASGSPRRKELLEQIGLEFEICPARGKEIISERTPEEIVKELAKQKAEEVYLRYIADGKIGEENTLFIGADTIVAYKDHILGKPKNESEAFEMIKMLQGKGHQVYTGVCLISVDLSGKTLVECFAEVTQVNVYSMNESDIKDYIRTGEPMDKAGAYAIQGYFAQYIKGIMGDYANVVGLPVGKLCKRLRELELIVHEE